MKKFTLLVAAALSVFAANAVESVDELVGTYISSYTDEYTTDYSADSWVSVTGKCSVTITKTGENTITLTNLGNLGGESSAIVDLTEGTITIDPFVSGYYTYSASTAVSGATDGYGKGNTDSTKPIVGKIAADGSISFYYVGSYYNAIAEIFSETLKKASAPEYTVNGHFAIYPWDDATEDYSQDAMLEGREATLVKYADADAAVLGFSYELKTPGTYPSSIQFSVDADDAVVITNGHTPTGYDYQVLDLYYLMSGIDEILLDPYDSFFYADGTTEGEMYIGGYYYPDYDDKSNYTYGKLEFCWGALDSIDTVKADKDDENAPAFDIMGRKVTDTTAPGIYIKNGKKFVVF